MSTSIIGDDLETETRPGADLLGSDTLELHGGKVRIVQETATSSARTPTPGFTSKRGTGRYADAGALALPGPGPRRRRYEATELATTIRSPDPP
jgi:hypothetical protein